MADFISSTLSLFTQGRAPAQARTSTAVSLGMNLVFGPPTPIPAPRDQKKIVPANQLVNPPTQSVISTVNSNLSAVKVFDAKGYQSNVFQDHVLDLGYQHMLEFDSTTLQGKITPAFASDTMNLIDKVLGGGTVSYGGADCRAIIEVADSGLSPSGMPRLAKQLLELTTITVSVHRVKSPVPAGGFINTKGFARGRRTIAGTMILTKFTAEVLYRFLQSEVFKDLSKDSYYMKIDQLPPFNISLLFCNESGYASYQRILGVEFVTDGNVYSIQDMLTEQTISYVAADFTPLAPLTFSNLFEPAGSDRKSKKEITVADVLATRPKSRVPMAASMVGVLPPSAPSIPSTGGAVTPPPGDYNA